MMPDICMCDGKDCPLREKCYRHLSEKNTEIGQTYFLNAPYNPKTNHCDHFIDIVKKGPPTRLWASRVELLNYSLDDLRQLKSAEAASSAAAEDQVRDASTQRHDDPSLSDDGQDPSHEAP